MSQKEAWQNDLSVESVPSTTIDLPEQKSSQISTDAKLKTQEEYGKWPLINYGRSEGKSTQELLFEAASEKDLGSAQSKWELFDDAVTKESLPKNKVRKMIGTLDEDKEWAALHYAVDCNNEELCSRLTSKEDEYQCDVNILGGNGENVLHIVSQSTCIWGDVKDSTTTEVPALVKLLVEKRGADVNHADDEGRTPLHMAAMRGRLHYIKYLIDHEAKVDSIDSVHQLPLLAVGAVEQDNILHICAKRQVSFDILDMIIKKLSADNTKELMAKQDSNGNLPLHLAAQINTKEELDIWKKLINEKNISEVLKFLSVKNHRGKTVAHEASEQGNVVILESMWKLIPPDDQYNRTKGLHVTADNNRFTCLHIAAKNGGSKELELIKYLIKIVRIEVDAIGDRRLTPLHIACEFGHLDVVKYLIEKGASTTLRNAQLLNCLEICIEEQHVELVKYLLQLPNWREMMRNAQTIEDTDAYDTPMRKLIRYMPDVALWVIEEKLTRKVGGAGQKVSKEIYDYEFYEDMNTVKQWYAQGAKLPPEDISCKARCHKLGVSAIFGCYISTGCCNRTVSDENTNASEPYTRDAYTLVRNHPLMIVSQQSAYPQLMAHQFHILLRKKMFRRFSTFWLAFSFLFYLILLGLAVGEIPTLMVEGTLWRNQMLYDFVSDGEILRLQFLRLMKFLCCYQLYRISRIRARPIHLLTFDDRANGWIGKAWYFTKKHFFEEKIQDDVELKISSNKDARPYWEEKEN
ncbi:unnamed protein product [Adineta steineri]|uniref:Uncharacterized protein n=1 Tax=Adineta steineri TaxID=433720 RepID=A0A819T683_9BILA|nr:unnamed protein product [Adineta steineri]